MISNCKVIEYIENISELGLLYIYIYIYITYIYKQLFYLNIFTFKNVI